MNRILYKAFPDKISADDWLLYLACSSIVFVSFLLNREIYAIGDDYHFYGFYFELGGMDYISAVRNFWMSPFAAGRPLAPVFDLFPLSMMTSIGQLSWVRLSHLFILLMIFVLLFRIMRHAGNAYRNSIIVVLCVFSLPGLWHLYMVSYGTSMLVGTLIALMASDLISRHPIPNRSYWVLFTALGAVVIFTYQPLWPLLFTGITIRILSPKIDIYPRGAQKNSFSYSRYAQTYVKIFAIVGGIFFLNYILVRYGYKSPRLDMDMDIALMMRHVLVDLIPITIYPWLYLFFPGNAWLLLLSWTTVLFSAFLVLRILTKAFRQDPRLTRFPARIWWIVLAILLSASLLPFSLGMYAFTDQAIVYRRVLYSSIYFWVVFLTVIINTTSGMRGYCVLRNGLYGFFFVLILFVGNFFDITTQRLAADELRSSICAAKDSPLLEQRRINRPAVLLPYHSPLALHSDEVQVRTLAYPTGAMLIWLSHIEAGVEQLKFTPWSLEFSDGSLTGEWEAAFNRCFTGGGSINKKP